MNKKNRKRPKNKLKVIFSTPTKFINNKANYSEDYFSELSKNKNGLLKNMILYLKSTFHYAKNNRNTLYDEVKTAYFMQLKDKNKIIAHLLKVLKAHPDHKESLLLLSDLYKNKNQEENSIYYFEKYLKYKPNDVVINYKLAEYFYNNYEKINNNAQSLYNQAIINNKNELSDEELSKAHYHLGMIQNISNLQELSELNFQKATNYSKYKSNKLKDIATLHEDYRNLQLALKTYKKYLADMCNDAQVWFEVGKIFRQLNQPLNAIESLEKSLELDKVLSPRNYELAIYYEDIGDYKNAEKWYKKAIERQQTHRPNNYRRLAYTLIQQNKFDEAFEAYKEAELFRAPSQLSPASYESIIKNKENRYAIYYENYKVDNQMVLYESMSGAGIYGNPAGVFDHIYEKNDFQNFKHVWVVKSFDVIPEKYRDKDNIIFVKRNSDAYLKYLSQAKYLVCDSRFADYFIRKSDQKYLQTSHGIFYKTVGRDSKHAKINAAGATRNLLQATHIIAPNDFMVEKQKIAYSINGIYSGQLAKVGYPRIDKTLTLTENEKIKLRQKLEVDLKKQIVLYAPTWRGDVTESNKFDIEQLVHDLYQLANLNSNILFRGHPTTKKLLKEVEIPQNIIIPDESITTNELLAITDVLISDYSSVFFDFIPTERPIVHYLYDVEEYVQDRGLNLKTKELPGFIAKNEEELIKAVKKGLNNPNPNNQYLKAKARFCPHDQGNSGRNVSLWFFYDDISCVELIDKNEYKNSDLYLGGELREVKDLSMFISHLEQEQNNSRIVSLIVKKKVAGEKKKINELRKLGKNVNLLAHTGLIPKTLEEIVALTEYNQLEEFKDEKHKELVFNAYNREARRLFGDTRFDNIINCEKNSNYWSTLAKVLESNHKTN